MDKGEENFLFLHTEAFNESCTLVLAVEFDHSGSYLALAGSDIRWIFFSNAIQEESLTVIWNLY